MMRRLTVAVLAILVLAAMPGVAWAQETDHATRTESDRPVTDADEQDRIAAYIEQIKARALEAIEERLTAVVELEAAINRSESVPAVYAEALISELQETGRGLAALAEQIRAASELEELRELVPKIFEFGVFKTLAPKVHLTLASSHALTFGSRLGEFAGHLEQILDRMAEHGIDVSEATAILGEMQRSIASGKEKAASIPALVIDLQPNDPEAEQVLRQAKSVLESAGGDLRSAAQAAHDVFDLIRRVLGQD